MSIDYKKLNDRIVAQAFMSLSQDQVKQMVQDKVNRAKVLSEANEAFARGSKYPTSR